MQRARKQVSEGMSFLAKVAAIKEALGLASTMPAPAALESASSMMGIATDHVSPDPEDVGPEREDRTPQADDGDNIIDEDDDEDEDDAPPAPRTAPVGFEIVDEPPPAAALTPKDPAQETLVGRSILYCWPSVGWCVGLITEANTDRRFKMEGEVVNFFVHYEIDDNKSRHVLKLDAYGGEVVDSWVLLEALA